MRVVVATVIAYALACVAAGLVLVTMALLTQNLYSGPGHPMGEVVGDLIDLIYLIGVFAAPGFLLVRGVFFLLRLQHWTIAAIAGVAAVYLPALLIIQEMPSQELVIAGGSAGVVYRLVEAALLRSLKRGAAVLETGDA